MKTKIYLLIGLSILFLYGNALAENFLQMQTSATDHNIIESSDTFFTSIMSYQSFDVRKPSLHDTLNRTAGMDSFSNFSDIFNEGRIRKTADWFFELIVSEDMKASLLNQGKSTRTPVPPAIYLLGTGLVGLAGIRGRHRRK